MATKADLINGAYSQLRISGLTVNPTGSDLSLALQRLENMAHELDLNVGYNFEDDPDPNSLSNLERRFWHAFETNLAVRLVPDFNKTVPDVLMRQASQSLQGMVGAAISTRQAPYPYRQPRGSGNTLRFDYGNRFFAPDRDAPNEPETNEMLKGEVNDYVEDFGAELRETETVSNYTIEASAGLFLVSHSLTSPNVDYRVRAEGSHAGRHQRVKITATTSIQRVIIRNINFRVTDPDQPE